MARHPRRRRFARRARRARRRIDFAESLATVAGAVSSVQELGSALDGLLHAVAGADANELLGELGTDLFNLLVIGWLERRHPVLGAPRRVGIIRPAELPELRIGSDGPVLRRVQVADRLRPDVVPALLADPTGELRAFYGLVPLVDTETAEAVSLLVGDRVQRLAGRLGGYSATGARGELGPDGGRDVALRFPSLAPGRSGGGRIDLRCACSRPPTAASRASAGRGSSSNCRTGSRSRSRSAGARS